MRGMKLTDDTALALLQTLLKTAADSAEGYATAAHDVEDPALLQLFGEYRDTRLKLAEALAERIRKLRETPEEAPTLVGALHRRWIDVKAGGAENINEAVLAEVERGEALAVDAYRQALKERDIDAATRKLIEQQYEIVQAAHDRVRQLHERMKTANG